jgi:hypothetical protein
VLLPGQRHRGAIDGEVDIVDDRAFFDLGPLRATRAAHHADDLLDHEFDAGTDTFIGENPNVFEAHKGRQDLSRVDEDEGASCL